MSADIPETEPGPADAEDEDAEDSEDSGDEEEESGLDTKSKVKVEDTLSTALPSLPPMGDDFGAFMFTMQLHRNMKRRRANFIRGYVQQSMTQPASFPEHQPNKMNSLPGSLPQSTSDLKSLPDAERLIPQGKRQLGPVPDTALNRKRRRLLAMGDDDPDNDITQEEVARWLKSMGKEWVEENLQPIIDYQNLEIDDDPLSDSIDTKMREFFTHAMKNDDKLPPEFKEFAAHIKSRMDWKEGVEDRIEFEKRASELTDTVDSLAQRAKTEETKAAAQHLLWSTKDLQTREDLENFEKEVLKLMSTIDPPTERKHLPLAETAQIYVDDLQKLAGKKGFNQAARGHKTFATLSELGDTYDIKPPHASASSKQFEKWVKAIVQEHAKAEAGKGKGSGT